MALCPWTQGPGWDRSSGPLWILRGHPNPYTTGPCRRSLRKFSLPLLLRLVSCRPGRQPAPRVQADSREGAISGWGRGPDWHCIGPSSPLPPFFRAETRSKEKCLSQCLTTTGRHLLFSPLLTSPHFPPLPHFFSLSFICILPSITRRPCRVVISRPSESLGLGSNPSTATSWLRHLQFLKPQPLPGQQATLEAYLIGSWGGLDEATCRNG